jgi:hypothetical protein
LAALYLVAGHVDSPVAALTRNNPQEAVLAKQAFGNFACRVNSVVVSTENPGEVETVTADSLRDAFVNVANLEWAHIAQSSFASFDGRNDEKILGTPGGDMGEFILAIHAYAKAASLTLTSQQIQDLFERYLNVMTRSKFFYETDEKAYIRLAVATGCRNLHISEVGGMKRKREEILSQIAVPEHIGDPFIRFLATNSTTLELNPDYIQACLAAYHNVLWTTPSILSQKLCYTELKGPRTEAALVHIKTSNFCIDQGLAPMVSPQLACPAPVFIYHAEAAKVLRRELATIFAQGQPNVNAVDILAAHNTLAENNLEKFMATISPVIPTFTVNFVSTSPLLSTDVSREYQDE